MLIFEDFLIRKIENKTFKGSFLDFIELLSDYFDLIFSFENVLLNFSELSFYQVLNLFSGWGKLIFYEGKMLSFGIDKCVKILGGYLIRSWERDNIFFTNNRLLFEMLLNVYGNTFFTKWQSAFLIGTELANQIRIMEVAFVVLYFACIASLGDGSFGGTEGFQHRMRERMR